MSVAATKSNLLMSGFSDGYREFRLWTLLELPGETAAWEVYGDTLSDFPDSDDEICAEFTKRLVRELWAGGLVSFVRFEATTRPSSPPSRSRRSSTTGPGRLAQSRTGPWASA
jgi:hypothetical protein